MLLAKSGGAAGVPESLLEHSCNVVRTARLIAERLPAPAALSEDLLHQLEAAAMVHDIGKAASGFQSWLRHERSDWHQWRHEILSAAFAAALGLPPEVVFAVLTHHKRIPSLHAGSEPSSARLRFIGASPEDWQPMLAEFIQNSEAVSSLWSDLCGFFDRRNLAAPPVALDPQFIDSAWRKADRQRRSISADSRRRASLLRGMLISADHLASGGVELPEIVRLDEFRPDFTLRPFQRNSAVRGNVILKAPTGSGKTEAALIWAACNQPRNGRLFYTLPYTAALNAMHARLHREYPASTKSIGLLHGRAAHHLLDALQNDYPGPAADATAEALSRARLGREMYHSVRVCTPHQLLRYSLRGQGWEQILTEIPGACIVLDEIHSYDARLAGYTLGTARLFHRLGANLMFISATLPSFLERIVLAMMPCAKVVKPEASEPEDAVVLNRVRHVVRIREGPLTSLLPDIVRDIESGRKPLIVCNHVRSAQTMAGLLRERLPSSLEVCLFHGRFNGRDRSALEKRLGSNALPPVLVATQVVEVSLDISYDCGYFEAAPIDALTQRMGRVNRQGGGDRPPAPIHIASEALNKHRIYDSAFTAQTLELLRKAPATLTEGDLNRIVDLVYARGYEGEDLEVFDEMIGHPYFTQFENSLVAGDHENWTQRVIEVENRIDVLPRSLLAEHKELMAKRLWLDADRLTVNIFRSQRVDPYLDRSHDPPIANLAYDSKDGLSFPK